MLTKEFCVRCFAQSNRAQWDSYKERWWSGKHGRINFGFVLCPPWDGTLSIREKMRKVRNEPPDYCPFYLEHKLNEQ